MNQQKSVCSGHCSVIQRLFSGSTEMQIPFQMAGGRSRTTAATTKTVTARFLLTAALASACLAFFRRALQMSRSSRRFSSSRLSFCRTGRLQSEMFRTACRRNSNRALQVDEGKTLLVGVKATTASYSGEQSGRTHRYRPPVSFQEVAQRSEEGGG